MKESRKIIVMCTLLVSVVLLSVGTIAYFRRVVNGNVTGNAGNLVLIVNEADAVLNETFTVSLNRNVEEPYVYPGDSGTFNLNIIATGSTASVDVTINMLRTNLPDNLKFYLDSEYTQELTTRTYTIRKADVMTITIPVYWYWDGSIDDENDTLFMGETLEANVSVSAIVHKPTFFESLIANSILDTNVNFGEVSSSTNGQGLMMRNGTQNDEYPIVYYRGDVSNNNVIFADFCWLIVRTTETGGIKLVFNGSVNDDGSCNNYSGVGGETANSDYLGAYINRTISAFNEKYDSPVYVGYMYNDTSKYFASGVLDASGYISHLADQSRLDNGTGKYTQNKYDSNIKGIIDSWYKDNILNTASEDLLEDTVWCSDRSVISETYTIENLANGTNFNFYFAANTRIKENTTVTPSLVCTRDVDKFTVERTIGNGDLDYPIGLLTADELNMAGGAYAAYGYGTAVITYLTIPSKIFWTMSPGGFSDDGIPGVFRFSLGDRYYGSLVYDSIYAKYGARPSISLNNSVIISGGNGSFATPYRVD